MSTTATESKPAPKIAEGITVEALVAALKDAGVVVKPKWNPKRTYARLLVGKRSIGAADKPSSRGMKVVAAVALGDLKNGVKKAHTAHDAGRYGVIIRVADEKALANAVAGLVAAHEKAQA